MTSVIVVWLILSIFVAVLAGRRGRNGFGWFLLSIVLTPLISLICVIAVGDTDEKYKEKMIRDAKYKESIEKDHKKADAQDSAIAELKKLKDLFELDVITKEEYEAKRAKLIPIINGTSSTIQNDTKESNSVDNDSKINKVSVKPQQTPIPANKLSRRQMYIAYGFMILLLIGCTIAVVLVFLAEKSKPQQPSPNIVCQTIKPNTPASTTNFPVSQKSTSTVDDKVVLSNSEKEVVKNFISYYNELIGFKNSADFKQIGFTQNGKYYPWLRKVQKFDTKENNQILTKFRVVVGDLESLSMEYVSSKGKETDLTKFYKVTIDAAIKQFNESSNPKPIQHTETQVQDKKAAKSLGKWRLTIAGVNGKIDLEIFKNGSHYYCVSNGKHKELSYENGCYYEVGNESGEYYKIKNGKLIMGDKYGDLPPDCGWIITKIK